MIVGVDVGTSVTKAALIGRDGRSLRTAARDSTLRHRPGGVVEQDLDDVIETVAIVVRDVCAGLDEPPEAVALTGQGDGLWLRDEHGVATRPPISWMDARATARLDHWRTEGVVERVHSLTGSGIFPGCHATLLAHLAEHEPESLDRAAVAGYCVDAVLQRLTGVISVDASDASLPFLDVRRREYVEQALEICGLSAWQHLLAAPAEPGTVFALSVEGSAVLGLPAGVPVTAGPYDLQACGFGSGARELGQGTVVVGTTLSCQVLTADPSVPTDSAPAGMWLCTPDPQTYLRVMPSMVGTAGIAWALGLAGARAEDLDDVLAPTTIGADGLRALPFLSESGERAPFVDPRAQGQLTGLSLSSQPADVVRAVCEAVAHAARTCFETIGLDGELSGCGGGLRSRALTQLFADVIGRPLHVPREDQVGARGAAAVAWAALGSPVDAEAWAADREVAHPRPEATAAYDVGHVRYLEDLEDARARWNR
ncbi:FGGY family carbohydrate kinase [Aeromicrobium sp. CTD01-1L150]|uniref:FGGY family carbohydrate kinase n=1 Tax=Aeromicrobium sp. CTD01-1L150 TaxID=3341830 RepID=UPI0035C0FABE